MNWLRRIPFRIQILLAAGTVLIIIVVGFTYAHWRALDEALSRAAEREALHYTRQIDTLARQALLTHDYEQLQDRLQALLGGETVAFAVVLDEDDRPVATYGWQDPVQSLPSDGSSLQWQGQPVRVWYHGITVDASGASPPFGRIVLGISLTPLETGRERLILSTALLLLFSLALGGVLLDGVARRLARRLVALAELSQTLAAGDLSRRAEVSGSDEVSVLAQSLNALADAVAARIEELRRRVEYDALTGLHSHTYFDEALDKLLQRYEPGRIWVCAIDLDHFAAVNDSCGHEAGDRVLRDVAHLMQEIIPPRVEHAVLAHHDADEFAACWVGTNEDEPNEALAREIGAKILAHPIIDNGLNLTVAASIGLVRADRVPSTVADLKIAADIARYVARQLGGNRVVNYLPTHPWVERRRREIELLPVIINAIRTEAFEPWAQRIVPVGEGRLHAEILMRLVTEKGERLTPGVFLSAAERFQLMPRIDRIVVRKVMADLGQRLAENRPWPADVVSLNVSGQTLSDEGWIDYLESLIHEHGIPPERLVFEMTESTVIEQPEIAVAFITRVRGLGAAIALDDFGSGTSSFGYLRRFTADYIKADGQFVRHVHERHEDRVIVQTMVSLARLMRMATIAEFVENDAIIATLRELGVDYLQGYAVHKPQPLSEL
ncbi:putative bifunctional diguanylate cyclase/phosphodiesterase [Tepidiphilus olei]|uniref:putative bifunctional diguanylate cyclase/phosphodiesterase n=1 Tax=Tepidiphilus olei TaxID=2502184 RepID=UPI00115E2156|nr:EAL domain-containing protein [Tepidiphilus olei]